MRSNISAIGNVIGGEIRKISENKHFFDNPIIQILFSSFISVKRGIIEKIKFGNFRFEVNKFNIVGGDIYDPGQGHVLSAGLAMYKKIKIPFRKFSRFSISPPIFVFSVKYDGF